MARRVRHQNIPATREGADMNKHLTLIPTTPPISLSWEEDASGPEAPVRPIFNNPSLTTANRMVCAHCGEDITHSSLRIAIHGSHRHAVATEHGIDQEIGCFSLAPGCLSAGHFALDFGHQEEGYWQMALCASCGNHLGWHHQTDSDIGFYGLILDHLAAAPEDNREKAA